MLNKAEYLHNQRLLNRLPVFYQPWYLDIAGIEWDVWMEVEGDYTCIFPFYKEKKWIFSFTRAQAPIMPYYGPIILSEKNETIEPISPITIQKLLSRCLKGIPTFSSIHITPTPFHQYPYEEYGFESKLRVTHLLDLSVGRDELWAQLDYMRQKNIKKADKQLILNSEHFDVEMYYEWIKETYKRRQQVLPFEKNIYQRFINAIIEHRAAIIGTYTLQDGTPVAQSVCVRDAFSAYSILGANNPEIKNNAATTALLWQAILQAQESGCQYFDFEGSTIEGIAQFFSKFGGQRIEYQGWHQTPSWLWRLKNKLF